MPGGAGCPVDTSSDSETLTLNKGETYLIVADGRGIEREGESGAGGLELRERVPVQLKPQRHQESLSKS